MEYGHIALLQCKSQPPAWFILNIATVTVFVGPCHHGMARPQVADGETASDMEGSCEYIE